MKLVSSLATITVSSRAELPAGLFQAAFVIAVIDAHLAVIALEDAVDETAQEVAVVADEDDRAGKVLQGDERRFARLDVEMVGRLVEDEQVD